MFFYSNQLLFETIIKNLGFFGLLSLILSIILVIVSYILIQQKIYKEKISAYECGFEPFEDARNKFDIRFYIVAILFLIFDIEVIYLFPWGISFGFLHINAFIAMIIFLVILILGFVYEIYMGALDWQ